MYKKNKILAVIPARGGSKGLPGKNIMPLAGKPLIAWTIEAALASKYLDKVIVSTDDEAIAKVAQEHGATVPFMRPDRLATDQAKSIDVMLYSLDHFKSQNERYEYVIMLEPTCPLRETKDIDASIEQLIDNKVGAVSIVGVSRVEAQHPAFDVIINKQGLIQPYLGDFKGAGRRQDISEMYFFEGTVYVSETEALYQERGFYHERTLPYIVPKWKSLEVDELVDLIWIEATLNNLKKIKETCDE